MSGNLKPHEAMREIVEIFDTYMVEGDPCWPLRRLREVMQEMIRVLSYHYSTMSALEKHHICCLILFEACRRHVWTVQGNERALRIYDHIINLCELHESAEDSNMTKAVFFPQRGPEQRQPARRLPGVCRLSVAQRALRGEPRGAIRNEILYGHE